MDTEYSTHYDILDALADAISVRPWSGDRDIVEFVHCMTELGTGNDGDEPLSMSVAMALAIAFETFSQCVTPEYAGTWVDTLRRSSKNLEETSSIDDTLKPRDLAILLACNRLTDTSDNPSLPLMCNWIDRCFPDDEETLDDDTVAGIIDGFATVFGLIVVALNSDLREQLRNDIHEMAHTLRSSSLGISGQEFPEAA